MMSKISNRASTGSSFSARRSTRSQTVQSPRIIARELHGSQKIFEGLELSKRRAWNCDSNLGGKAIWGFSMQSHGVELKKIERDCEK